MSHDMFELDTWLIEMQIGDGSVATSSQAESPYQPKKYKLWTWKVFAKSLYQNLTIESLSFLFCNVTFDGFVKNYLFESE